MKPSMRYIRNPTPPLIREPSQKYVSEQTDYTSPKRGNILPPIAEEQQDDDEEVYVGSL